MFMRSNSKMWLIICGRLQQKRGSNNCLIILQSFLRTFSFFSVLLGAHLHETTRSHKEYDKSSRHFSLLRVNFLFPGDTRRESSSADPDGDQTSLHGPHGQGQGPEAGDHGEAAVWEGATHQATLPSPSWWPCDRNFQVAPEYRNLTQPTTFAVSRGVPWRII